MLLVPFLISLVFSVLLSTASDHPGTVYEDDCNETYAYESDTVSTEFNITNATNEMDYKLSDPVDSIIPGLYSSSFLSQNLSDDFLSVLMVIDNHKRRIACNPEARTSKRPVTGIKKKTLLLLEFSNL